MTEALVVHEPRCEDIQLGTLNASTPDALLAGAAAIATPLAKMIAAQHLASNINGKNYVRCEGWTTMGAMLGIVPREMSNTCDSEGIFSAVVELVNMKTGAVVGRASAECGAPDELDRQGKPLWANRPRYARRSMAATRATSKAFRLSFSWIMTLAGYESTPAEEVPDGGFGDRPTVETTAKPAPKASPLPAAPPGTLRFVGRVAKFETKAGATWTKVGIRVEQGDGMSPWLSTLDKTLGELCKRYHEGQDIVEVWYVDDGKFKNVTDISPVIFES